MIKATIHLASILFFIALLNTAAHASPTSQPTNIPVAQDSVLSIELPASSPSVGQVKRAAKVSKLTAPTPVRSFVCYRAVDLIQGNGQVSRCEWQ